MPALGTVNSTTSVATSAELAAHEADTTAIHGITDTADLATASSVTAHTGDATDAHDASAVSVVPFATIAATDVQAALEEIVAEVAGGGAPTTADYLVGTAQAGLSAEIVVGATPGGELGGTWGSPTVDATHSGSTHSAAADAHIADAADAHDASAISYDPTASGMTATEVQAAIDELDAAIGASHVAVTVGTGLDVTGQLVELDLSEVAAGGELGGFMDAPTVDATHSGSTHAATQAAAEATAAGALTTHAAAADPHTGYVREADANWIDLTDSGATTLHSHAGGGGLSHPQVLARALGA